MSQVVVDESIAEARGNPEQVANVGADLGRVTRGSRVVSSTGEEIGTVIGAQPAFLVTSRGALYPVMLYVPVTAVRQVVPGTVIVTGDSPAGAWERPPSDVADSPRRSGSSRPAGVASSSSVAPAFETTACKLASTPDVEDARNLGERREAAAGASGYEEGAVPDVLETEAATDPEASLSDDSRLTIGDAEAGRQVS